MERGKRRNKTARIEIEGIAKMKNVKLRADENSLVPVQEKAGIALQEDNQTKAVANPSGTDTFMSLNAEEKAIIENWRHERKIADSRLNFTSRQEADGTTAFGVQCSSSRGSGLEKNDLSYALICRATGAKDTAFGIHLFTSCLDSSRLIDIDKPDTAAANSNAIMNALSSLRPQDEIEGMLITRMIALHFQGMHYMRCAANKESTAENRDSNINRTTKLSRLYNETLDALMRYRRKGEQKVIVQHQNVQVNDGGQAIVSGYMTAGGSNYKNVEVTSC